jgi:hypothetical protein
MSRACFGDLLGMLFLRQRSGQPAVVAGEPVLIFLSAAHQNFTLFEEKPLVPLAWLFL